jgi:hypothetical protein
MVQKLLDSPTHHGYFLTDMTELQVLPQQFQYIPVRLDKGHVRSTATDGFDPHSSGPSVEIQKSAVRKPITEN